MALTHLTLSLPSCCGCRNIVHEEQRDSNLGVSVSLSGTGSAISRLPNGFFREGFQSRYRGVIGYGRLNVAELQTVENDQIRTGVEIPVTCYQIIGVPDQAEKDNIVKSVMDLKSAEIEEGYTLDVLVSRQELLMDVRDKLLFEPEYAGNAREKIPPKSSLRIPWAWLPGALCLLQEVGEEKLVLEIGRAALQHPDAKPYIHDFLLSMALAECAIAKIGFEKNKVSQGFEALARAQYLLRSKISLGKMPLLSQIEESLEELAPACTLELLGMPHTPENAERRRGAIAALRELLRQGLDVETACRVQDWPCFLSQSLNKLMATEIVDLLPWDNIAAIRKNRKSLESQNQRVVVDFSCFYMAMIAHIAVGFSSKQIELINKAKTICECLVASEGIDLKFEEALCSFLLGQGDEAEAIERLQQLEINSGPTSQNFLLGKDIKDGSSVNPSLEIWLKDAVLGLFPDTRDCSPSLVNFFGGEKKALGTSKHCKGTRQNMLSGCRRPTFVAPDPVTAGKPLQHLNYSRHLGLAVKQLAPTNTESSLMGSKTASEGSTGSVQLKRNLGSHHKKVSESWWASGNVVARIMLSTILGCFVFATFKVLGMQFGHFRSGSRLNSNKPKMHINSLAWTVNPSLDHAGPACIDGSNIGGRLGKLFLMFRNQFKYPFGGGTFQSSWPADELCLLNKAQNKKPMPIEEAETLVKQWQAFKAQALGPSHCILSLSEILAESMLSQWQDLADAAKSSSCYWRFVLLHLSILRADIFLDGTGGEIAEIEALLEEAAELVDEYQAKNPNYYSKYKIHYALRRQCDGSWKFCRCHVQTTR
ncbi:plastid division protein CDP1, chloroplastic isoform X2 [Macadamia integrifolia]|uniref:plastid division protein CDP1, chloroplastic isoform X2 n=1 Tax=Macadamia integrifolia TaxID=60698 RepID=UPI001C4F96F8|nr:plastid division protein CDP1, chloroplastic isoform X2 [Macadamia integrifolia]